MNINPTGGVSKDLASFPVTLQFLLFSTIVHTAFYTSLTFVPSKGFSLSTAPKAHAHACAQLLCTYGAVQCEVRVSYRVRCAPSAARVAAASHGTTQAVMRSG